MELRNFLLNLQRNVLEETIQLPWAELTLTNIVSKLSIT
jgi:hypothetical protein